MQVPRLAAASLIGRPAQQPLFLSSSRLQRPAPITAPVRASAAAAGAPVNPPAADDTPFDKCGSMRGSIRASTCSRYQLKVSDRDKLSLLQRRSRHSTQGLTSTCCRAGPRQRCSVPTLARRSSRWSSSPSGELRQLHRCTMLACREEKNDKQASTPTHTASLLDAQVWPEHRLQPEEQGHLQLLPLPLDGVGHPRGGRRRLLRADLPAGLQEGLLRQGALLCRALLVNALPDDRGTSTADCSAEQARAVYPLPNTARGLAQQTAMQTRPLSPSPTAIPFLVLQPVCIPSACVFAVASLA